jgi:hypothetical protein
MHIEIFCLCRAVTFNTNREPSLIDIFDTHWATGEPALIEPFVVAASVRFYSSELGLHRFEFVVTDDTGMVLVRSTEIVSISELSTPSMTHFIQSNMGRTGLRFGAYEFSIQLAGKRIAHSPMYVKLGTR